MISCLSSKNASSPSEAIDKVYLNENWQGRSDIILTCKDFVGWAKDIKYTQFYVEKTVLACHSVVFANMF